MTTKSATNSTTTGITNSITNSSTNSHTNGIKSGIKSGITSGIKSGIKSGITSGIMSGDDFLTPQQVAAKLQVSIGWVYSKIRTRELKGYTLGKYLRVRSVDLEAFIEARRIG